MLWELRILLVKRNEFNSGLEGEMRLERGVIIGLDKIYI